MRKVVFKGRAVEVPECIDELTPEQYSYYILLATSIAEGAMGREAFGVRWLSFLLGMGEIDFTLYIPEIASPLRVEAAELAKGFICEDADRLRLDFMTCRNLLPICGEFSGPADWLSELPFGKFMECMALMSHMDTPEETEEACEGVARVLYSIPEEAKVPPVLMWHAPTLFANVWHVITSEPVDINGQLIDFSIIFRPGTDRRPDDKTGWTGIAFEVAAAGLFGSMKELEQVDFWAVLLYLYKCKFEYIHDNNK